MANQINTPYLLQKIYGVTGIQPTIVNIPVGVNTTIPTSPSTSTSTSTTPTTSPARIISNEEKSKGVIGTGGPSSETCPKALTLQQIDALTTAANPPTELRRRAIRIALSYIGADELPGNNVGWYDNIFQDKMEKLGQKWQKGFMWCNCFTNLVWTEAYTTGNALVPASNNPVYENTFKKVFRKMGFFTAKSKEIKVSNNTHKTFSGFTSKFNGKYAITRSEAESGTKLPQPGDMVAYTWGHIAIVLKVVTKNGKLVSFDTIDGNASPRDPRDGGDCRMKKRLTLKEYARTNGVLGFCMLEETYT